MITGQEVATKPARGAFVDVWPAMSSRRSMAIVIEDDWLLAEYAASLLEDLGYEVVGRAFTEATAIELVTQIKPDLVLMDIGLGLSGSGLIAARTIRQRHDGPIVFCSAYAGDAAVALEVGEIGRSALIGKPLERSSLQRALSELA